MTHFLEALAYETALLQRYITLSEWERRLFIHKIISQDLNVHALAVRRLDKLAFLKTLFFEWAHEQRARKVKIQLH